PAHGLLGTELERLTDRLTSRNGGGAVDLVLQGVTTDRVRVSDGLTPLGGIDDQGNFVVLDHVNHMRTTFGHLVHPAHRQAGCFKHLGGTGGSDYLEAQRNEITRDLNGLFLVILANADEGTAGVRQDFAGTDLCLGEGFAEAVADAHHLTGGFHFRAEDRVDTRELGEGEHRFLDAEERRNDFLGVADFDQALAGHDACSHLGQRFADALGDEGHGTRGARVHLDNIDVFALHGHLHVHQTDHTEFQSHFLDLLADLILDVLGQRVRRQRAGRVTGVHAGLFDVLHDRADHHGFAVADRVHVHFDGAVEEAIEQHRAVVGHLHSFAHVALELFFLVD